MNRKILLFCAVTTPLFIFAVIAQSLNFQELNKSVKTALHEQARLIEKNQILETGINVLSSPERIGPLASKLPRLQRLTSDQSLKIQFSSTPSSGGVP